MPHCHRLGRRHANRPGGAVREVERHPGCEWAAIVDPHIHLAAVGLVGHSNQRVERQSAMRGRHSSIRIEDFTAGRAAAVIRLGIVRRETFQIAGCNGSLRGLWRLLRGSFDLNLLVSAGGK